MPLALIKQWIKELQRFSELFNVHIYHKKSITQKTTTTGVTRIVESFKNSDDLFSGDKWTSQVVVISTYSVIASHHGPNALQKWRKGQLGKGVKLNPKLFKVPKRSWEHDLQYYWHTIILDEAHNVRNPNCLASIAVVNIDCRFNILVSATPLFSGIRDNFGLLKIIQPIFKLSYPVSGPDGTMFSKNDNPFDLPDDHPAAIFRLTAGSFSAFVLNLTDSVKQGRRLEAIWQHCLLYRRYTSCCPIDSGKNEIGGALPRCETIILDLELPPPAQKVYDHFSEGFLKKLMATNQTRSGDNRVIINANSYRALVLISTWPLLTLSQPAINPPRSKQNWSKRSRVLFNIEKSIAKHTALQLIPANLKLPDSPEDVLKTIAIALQNSSRLSTLVANIADQVVKRKEKAII